MKTQITELIRSKRRTISIQIERDGKMVVRAPLNLPLTMIQKFVDSKQNWIEAKINEARLRHKVVMNTLTNGDRILLLGHEHSIHLDPSASAGLQLTKEGFFLKPLEYNEAKQVFERWYKKTARKILSERLEYYSNKFGYTYSKMRITSARTRWGSCSSKGTISFTWRLVMAPMEVVDYVVVHELVHLGIHNHSQDFWRKVESFMPDYKTKKHWLRVNGEKLDL